jgi:hypothetical protein
MRRYFIGFLIMLFLSSAFFACGSTEQTKKKGLTKEQRERMDKDKKEFEEKLPEDEDDG